MSVMTRPEYEAVEEKFLAPYASKSGKSKGRMHVEPEHPFRTAFQRDRDRIVHSRAFRRLEYKTQVFVNHEGDHYRTRLTHTMEVAQITRNIARALRLNEDLAETIALAHDVGHPPFGHSGEKALDVMMKDVGGFEHNQQSLRIVEILEKRYPQFSGLNLTWEVRQGIQKHPPGRAANNSSLECQTADLSDDTAYLCHDVDDGLASGLLKESDLLQVRLWSENFKEIADQFSSSPLEIRCYYTVRNIINSLVTNLIEHTSAEIQKNAIQSVEDVQNTRTRIVDFSPEVRKKVTELREFLMSHLYRHPEVDQMNRRAHKIICNLFALYIEKPDLLPETTYAKLKQADLKQVVCDYVAGMTDRFAIQEHKRLFEIEDKF